MRINTSVLALVLALLMAAGAGAEETGEPSPEPTGEDLTETLRRIEQLHDMSGEIDRAVEKLNRGEVDEMCALGQFHTVNNPTSGTGRYILGLCYFARGNFGEGRRNILMALETGMPTRAHDIEARFTLARAAFRQTTEEGRVETCTIGEALDRDYPKVGTGRYVVAMCLLREGKNFEARESLARGIKMGMHTREAQIMARFDLSVQELGSGEEDVQALGCERGQDLIREYPKSGAGWYIRGFCSFKKGEYEAGKVDMQRAVALGLGNPHAEAMAYHNLAGVALRDGDWDGARRLLDRSLELDPYYPPALSMKRFLER